jgi:hypothetical protein
MFEVIPKIIKKYLAIIIIALSCILVWYKTLNQIFMGEGYSYFDPIFNLLPNGNFATLWRMDNFARLLFDIFPSIFRDNISYYLAFQFLVLVILTTVFFYFVKYFTKNSWIGFGAAIIFGTSYLGLFEMIGTGNYQRFSQRIPNIIPEILALLELVKYFDTKKIKYYVYSLVLFFISVFMGHFSTFLLPVFVIYPVIFSIVNKSGIAKLVKSVLFSIPFVLINRFLLSRDFYTPSGNFIGFIKEVGVGKIISLITLQFSNMLIPPFLVEKVASITSSYEGILIILTVPILIIFLTGIYLVTKRKQKNLLIVYLVSIFSIPVLLFLNLYLRKVDPFYNMRGYTYYFLPRMYSINPSLTATVKGDRYYMLPYLFVAIILSILIYIVFNKKLSRSTKNPNSLSYKTAAGIFLTFYVAYNTFLVWTNINKIQPVSEDLKKYLSYIKSVSSRINNQSVVVIPREFLWPSSMIKAIYGYPDMKFASNDTDWKKQITNKKDLVLIDFYYDQTKDGKINVAQNRVIDLTDWANYNLPSNE